MDFWTDIAIAVILRLLSSRKESEKNASAIAKVYVRARRLVETSPLLQKAVEAQEAKL